MAISVDRVYQKVLALANKEQRGYITPQEFNLFADHAQMDIFEQYFYDLNQRQRMQGTEIDYADITTNIEEKISIFEKNNVQLGAQGGNGEVFISGVLSDFYRLGNINVSYDGYEGYCDADPIRLSELRKYEKSPLGLWGKTRPVYSKYSTISSPFTVKIYPAPTSNDSVYINYIRKPKKPNWTYLISGSKNALYNPSATDHQDFELHSSEENNLVLKILQLAGISIKDFQLTGVAAQEEMKGIQQEKQ